MLPDLRRALRSLAWPLLGFVILIAVIVVMTSGSVDDLRPFVSVAVAMLAIVALTALQKSDARVREGWHYLTPSAMEWFALIGSFAITALMLWVYHFVGSARADAATQMLILKCLIAAFAAGTGLVFFTSFAYELRWNDRSIEQRRLLLGANLLGAKTLRFADIVAGGMNPLTQAVWVADADGTVIRFSPYANGAESLARMIFRPEDDDPTE
jgi:Ni/Fe-hydrogenase subunit HybB-like protein